MTTFLIWAAVLILVAVAIVTTPLLRKFPNKPRAAGTAIAVIIVLGLGAAGLYRLFSNWSWAPASSAQTPEAMVARLARRLERNPQDIDGWLMLGRSYAVLGQYPLAARSYRRADRLAGGKNAEALMGWAEALAMSDEKELDGRAGRIIEQALTLDPRSGKALFYGAAVALRRGDLRLARERFASLLALNPPDNVKPILQEQIAAIDRQLATQAP